MMAFSLSVVTCLLWALWLSLAYLCICAVATAIVYRRGAHHGPMVWPILGCTPLLFLNGDRLHDLFADLHGKYGPCFTYVLPGLGVGRKGVLGIIYDMFVPSLRMVSTTSPEVIEYALKTNFKTYQKGEVVRELSHDILGKSIFTVDGEAWKQQRKIASFEFSSANLRSYMSLVFQEHSEAVSDVLGAAACSGRVVDMEELCGRYSFDNIIRVACGVDFQSIRAESTPKLVNSVNKMMHTMFVRFHTIPVYPIFRFFNIFSERVLTENRRVFDEFAFSVIQARRKECENEGNLEKRSDMLSRFMMLKDADGEPIDDRYLRDILATFTLAGKDTITTTLAWLFYALSCHPDVMRKAREEVERVVGDEKIVTWQHAQDLHYLHAVLSETLRLYPALPQNGRICQKDDVLPDGTRIYKGDFINYQGYTMGRLEALWGPDAREFKPERWLDKDGNFQPQSQYTFIAFHGGPRLCLGKDMAYLSVKILVATLLRLFSFSTLPGYSPKFAYDMLLSMANGLPMKIARLSTSSTHKECKTVY